MPKSQYVTMTVYPGDTEGKEITEAQERFEQWLSAKRDIPAVDGAPYNSAEGGYLGTIDAEDRLSEYLVEHAEEHRFLDELREHCWAIGELWNDGEWR